MTSLGYFCSQFAKVTIANWPSMTSTFPIAPLCLLHVLQLSFTTPTGIGILQLFSFNSSSFPSNPIHPIIPQCLSHPFSLPPLFFCIIHLPVPMPVLQQSLPSLTSLACPVTSYISPSYLNTLSVLSASNDKIFCIPFPP